MVPDFTAHYLHYTPLYEKLHEDQYRTLQRDGQQVERYSQSLSNLHEAIHSIRQIDRSHRRVAKVP